MSPTAAETPDFRRLFEQTPAKLLALLPDPPRFTIIGASDAYLHATPLDRDRVLGEGLFEVCFTETDDASIAASLRASLGRVIERAAPDTMTVQPDAPGGAVGGLGGPRSRLQNTPVLGAHGEVLYIVHAVHDATDRQELHETRRELREARAELDRLRDKTRAFQSVLEGLDDAVVITEAHPLDAPGPAITYVNPAFTEQTGYAAEEAIGRDPRFLQGPDTDRDATRTIRLALMRGEPARVELLNYRKDGVPFWVDLNLTPIRDVDGRITRWVSVQPDSAERHAEEERARRLSAETASRRRAVAAMERLQTILGSLTDGFLALDRDGRVTYANDRALQALDCTADAIGREILEVAPHLRTTHFDRCLSDVLADHVPVTCEVAIPDRGRWTQIHASPMPEGAALYLHDVTDRKRAEAALAEAHEMLDLALTAGRIGTWHVDLPTGRTHWDAGMAELFGHPPDRFAGGLDAAETRQFILADDLPLVDAALDRAIHGDGTFAAEYRVHHADGSVRWLAARGRREDDPTGTPVRLSGVALDATGRHEADEALRLSEAKSMGIVSIAADAIVSIDESHRITLFNHGAEVTFGYAAEEVLGQHVNLLLPAHARAHHDDLIEAFGRSETASRRMGDRGLVSGLRKNGEIFPAEASISKISAGGRRVYTAVVRDMTDRVNAEEELQQAIRNLRALIEASPLAVVAMDLAGRVELWNGAAERMFGWSADEVIGHPSPIIPADRKDELVPELRAGEAVTGLRTRRTRRDGSEVAVNVSSAPLHGPAGGVRGVLVLIEDVTESRAIEEAQRRLAAILEATPDLVATIDPAGRLQFLNRAGRERLGVHEPVGRAITDFFPAWAVREILTAAIPDAIRRGSWSGESAFLDASGVEVPVSLVFIAHADASGEVVYLSTIQRDITERKRADEIQRFLAEASRRLSRSLAPEDIVAAVSEMAIPRLGDWCITDLVDDDGRVRRTGFGHVDPQKVPLVQALARFPPQRSGPMGAARTLESGEPEIVTEVTEAWLRAVSQDDEHLDLLRALAPKSEVTVAIQTHDDVIGAITCAFAESGRRHDGEHLRLADNLAERAALAIDNARLYSQVQRAVRTRDEVLRVVAHDLRNPLATITLAASIALRNLQAGDEARDAFETIGRSARRADALVRDLLAVARMERKGLSVQTSAEPAGALVTEAVELHRSLAGERGVTLEVHVEPGLPPVLADRSRILQVLSNLIGNALKVVPTGGAVTVRAEPGGRVVRFAVGDTGPGIPPDQLPHLFEPFWQAGPQEREGAGLGLTIVKGVVEAHGGQVGVDSPPGAGATFWFTLGVADTDAVGAGDDA